MSAISEKLRADSTREAQWNVIRYYYKCGQAFTAKKVAFATCATLRCVRQFLMELKDTGLIKRAGYAQKAGVLWQLTRDIGPKTPVHRANGFFDPNSKTLLPKQPKTKTQENP